VPILRAIKASYFRLIQEKIERSVPKSLANEPLRGKGKMLQLPRCGLLWVPAPEEENRSWRGSGT
jgi:hypothetical protein